ncbi:MAG: hypothetical protein J7L59_02950 [Nanoarchaeota archaeon]|nr:hypothetical protein [Nanoarchaeota archaeon]
MWWEERRKELSKIIDGTPFKKYKRKILREYERICNKGVPKRYTLAAATLEVLVSEGEAVSLEDVVSALGISRGGVTKVVKRLYGRVPSSSVDNYVERALHLLGLPSSFKEGIMRVYREHESLLRRYKPTVRAATCICLYLEEMGMLGRRAITKKKVVRSLNVGYSTIRTVLNLIEKSRRKVVEPLLLT